MLMRIPRSGKWPRQLIAGMACGLATGLFIGYVPRRFEIVTFCSWFLFFGCALALGMPRKPAKTLWGEKPDAAAANNSTPAGDFRAS